MPTFVKDIQVKHVNIIKEGTTHVCKKIKMSNGVIVFEEAPEVYTSVAFTFEAGKFTQKSGFDILWIDYVTRLRLTPKDLPQGNVIVDCYFKNEKSGSLIKRSYTFNSSGTRTYTWKARWRPERGGKWDEGGYEGFTPTFILKKMYISDSLFDAQQEFPKSYTDVPETTSGVTWYDDTLVANNKI